MEHRRNFPAEAAYVTGIALLAFGTALMTVANLGLSMVVAPAYLLHLKLSEIWPAITFGRAEYIVQVLLLVGLCVALRKFRPYFLFSFFSAIFYGAILDLFLLLPFPPLALPGRIAFYLLGILSLLVVFALPTSWVYDLGLKAGTEQGQRPGAQVQAVQTREDIHTLILANAPATVSPEGLIPCPLARLRDSEQSNRRIHYSSGRRSSRTFQGFDDYRVLPRDPGALDRLWQLLWGGTYNNGYFLKPLEDGTYICVYLDDCAFLFGEPEELYTGVLRGVDAPEEARMLHAMEAAGYDLDTSFILDMARFVP